MANNDIVTLSVSTIWACKKKLKNISPAKFMVKSNQKIERLPHLCFLFFTRANKSRWNSCFCFLSKKDLLPEAITVSRYEMKRRSFVFLFLATEKKMIF
ncbi:hypothetical protein CEXT_105851 [Caerostris extrusa]|uniref:Uncharacterized protein n=1 Tax=Caerostris extrusa TaxID=172846 RepID=A0AAV4UMV0_CAEEX|nr:hypothetical protein CEXT_105851 [Caerostris extrusa]